MVRGTTAVAAGGVRAQQHRHGQFVVPEKIRTCVESDRFETRPAAFTRQESKMDVGTDLALSTYQTT